MKIKSLTLEGFKSFAERTVFQFNEPFVGIVGPNGSGKSNIVEAFRFVLGEQSMKGLRASAGVDMVFVGTKTRAASRRAFVQIDFDNQARTFNGTISSIAKIPIDFDTISISREVKSDGTNTYSINGHVVRLKDIQEILSNANISGRGHQIVSQGGADKYLVATPSERKTLIEDALGLQSFYYKIKDAESKIEKSLENKKEGEINLREITPRLTSLNEKIKSYERAKNIRDELEKTFLKYLYNEEQEITAEQNKSVKEKTQIEKTQCEIKINLEKVERLIGQVNITKDSEVGNKLIQEELKMNQDLANMSEELGKLEGIRQSKVEYLKQAENTRKSSVIATSEITEFCEDIIGLCRKGKESEEKEVKSILEQVHDLVKKLLGKIIVTSEKQDIVGMNKLESEIKGIDQQIGKIQEQIKSTKEGLEDNLRKRKEQEKDKEQHNVELDQARRDYYDLLYQQKTIADKIAQYEIQQRQNKHRADELENDKEIAKGIFGAYMINHKLKEYIPIKKGDEGFDREETRHQIERMRIQIEEIGHIDEELIVEHRELEQRKVFLEKEIADITETISKLVGLRDTLRATLEQEFSDGIENANTVLKSFFEKIFPGGEAKLTRSKRKIDEETEIDGVEIQVRLPRKKITRAEMFSGGERTLVSLSILFALVHVERPPFLVLDETDAALDESNSRIYNELLGQIAKHTQTIAVTHNRETMSCAQKLYGILLGRDDTSRTISLHLEDAMRFIENTD